MSDLVAVATYPTSPDAHILRGRLEADGIFAAVADDENYLNGAMGGAVRVMVRLEDYPEALKIKRECKSTQQQG